MRVLPAGMQAHLDTGATTLCKCWKLTRGDGLVLGFTDHDRNIEFDGVTFEAASGFEASEMVSAVGLGVDNLDVSGALTSDALSEEALSAGLFDNAEVEIWTVNFADVAQRLLVRKGNIGEVKRSDTGFTAEIRGLAHELNQPQGRLFQFSCDADLGDPRCTVDLNQPAFKGSGAVVSVSSRRRFVVSGLDAFDDNWFAEGRLTWTGGANSGRAMEVVSQARIGSEMHVALWQAMSLAVTAGDTFAITAGCDKQPETCKAKFNNFLNFRGFPHMPGNDFAVSYPVRGETRNDGSKLTG